MAENRRVRMTKMMIKDAMLELLEKQSLEKITVTDVCERADVNRSTFYAYYEDTRQLLLEIEEDVIGQLPVSPDSPATYSNARFLATLEAFFAYVRENERLFRILLVQRDSSSFHRRLIDAVMQMYQIPTKGNDALMDRYTYVYCINGVIGILKEWITENFPMSTREFAQIVLQLSAKATS